MKQPGPNYRMSKAGKISLAVNALRSGKKARQRAVVQAELYSSEVARTKRDKEN